MIHPYCIACQSRRCANPSTHRASGDLKYRVDIMVGGRHGVRVRKLCDSKNEAVGFELEQKAKYHNEGELPNKKGKTLLSEIITRYYQHHIIPSTRQPERSSKYRIEQLVELVGGRPIGTITLNDLEEIRAQFKEDSGSSNANVNRLFSVLKTVLNRAVEWGFISKSPAQFLRDLPVKETLPRFLTEQEINQLRRVVTDDRLIKRMNAILHTGIRPIDLDNLSWSQVDLVNRVIQITTHKGRRPHTYPVPIDDVLIKDINERYEKTGGRGLVYDSSNLKKLAIEAIKESGLNDKRKPEEYFTLYGLKHCYASHLLMSGATIFDVAKLLGHTDTKMVVHHYGHLTLDHLRKTQARVNLTPVLDKVPQLRVI